MERLKTEGLRNLCILYNSEAAFGFAITERGDF
ncbi:MAG: hypothetical protein K0R76_1171 [Alphaproteobacteria bacterium]|jgi:hypothetical protein|nr:hypothetical protein [Alphaproteobacteria bacterium]